MVQMARFGMEQPATEPQIRRIKVTFSNGKDVWELVMVGTHRQGISLMNGICRHGCAITSVETKRL